MHPSIMLLLFALSFLSGGLRTNSGVPPKWHVLKNWKLAFVRGGSIWVANGNGTNQRKIITDADAPCWSPDKTRLAFARYGDVWIARADGTHQRRLTRRWNWNPKQMERAR